MEQTVEVEQEWLMAILAVTNDAMVIEVVRDRQIAMARNDDRSENGSGLV